MLQFDGTVTVANAVEKADFYFFFSPCLGLSLSLFSCISTNAHLVLKRAERAENVA